MYHSIFVFSSVLSGVFCGVITINTKADLLAAIRQDLRRNNDDYIESTITEQTLLSSPPPSTSQVLPVGIKTLKTTNKLITTKKDVTTLNFKTTIKPPTPYRRSFQSSEILPVDDNPKKFKHRPIKMAPSQFLMTITKIPGNESKKQTRVTRTNKTSDTERKNDLGQPWKKISKQKFSVTTGGKAKGSESDGELEKIHAFMKDLEKKGEMNEASTLQAITGTKTQGVPKAVPHRVGLLMGKINGPPMVVPLRDKPPVTPDVLSIEDPSAPWEKPRLETTRGEVIRMGVTRNSNEMPLWRAVASKEEEELNKIRLVYNRARNETTNKPKTSEKNIPRADKMKLRQKKSGDANKIIQDLKMKLREGIKLSSLPPGELLDMWPARGPRVHAMRLRNRLCQRSVLLNEGPKYDSKGGTYMPRFKPRLLGTKTVIDFHQTKMPKFLLPRCCNCCRKSVLGCE